MKNIFVAFLFLISIASNAQKIIAGPMLGHTDFRTAKVWVHFKADLKDAVLSFTEKNKNFRRRWNIHQNQRITALL